MRRSPAAETSATIDAAFAARAIPAGSARQLSYLFAPPELRAPLLGIYALLAEWQALLDPATERPVAQLKLAWWREEMERLAAGSAVHPVSRYLASQPGAAGVQFLALGTAVEAAMLELSGVPLERGADLASHSRALLAGPLQVASFLGAAAGGPLPEESALAESTQALATAQYLARALGEYRRAATDGRMPFPIDELLHAGIENNDLIAAQPPQRLQTYLTDVRARAQAAFGAVSHAIQPASRASLRHLLVLAALGRRHLNASAHRSAFMSLKDMLLAWTTARRA